VGRHALLLSLVLAATGAASASDTIAFRDTVYRLPEILVEAERITEIERLRERPAFLAIIPMDDASHRVSSAADYLAQTVGCHVRSTGGYGAYSTASVRGSSAKQVRVFIDGIPLSQSRSGIIDLADLPLSSLSRIEVYRGFGPYDLSGSSIGGVMNLVTKKPDAHGRGQLSISYGSLSTLRLQGSYSVGRSGWDLLAIGSALSTEGDFEFLDDNGTPYNKEDDEMVPRANNEMDEYEGLLKASRPVRGGVLVASNQFYHRSQGLPGYSAVQSRTQHMSKTYDLFHLAWTRRSAAGSPLGLASGCYCLYQVDSFEDRRPKTTGAKPDERNITLSLGANVRWHLALPGLYQHAKGIVEVSREAFRPEETFSGTLTGEQQTRQTLVITLEDDIRLIGGRLRLIPSARYERYADRMQPFNKVRSDMQAYYRGLRDTTLTRSQRIGTIAAVASPGAGISLKANYGRYYRVPSLMEIFGYRGMAVPNPGLNPEAGRNCDIGFSWDPLLPDGYFLTFEYAYFWSDVEDLIMFVYVPFAQAAQAINIDSADIEGYELSLSCGDWHGFTLAGNLTHLVAVNTGPVSYTSGKRLPNRPEYEGFASLRWHSGRLSAFYEFDYISGNYWNAVNGIAPNNKGPLFPVRRLHNLGLTVPTALERADLTLEVRNLTDEHCEDVMGYPLPGRSVYATLVIGL
jgi:outer membrane cobalamin receptor